MAYSVSDNYRKVIYSGGANHTALLTINNNSIPVKQIKKITISDPLFDNAQSTFNLGQYISKQIEIYFNNMDSIPLEGNVHLEIGTLVNNVYEYVPIGEFQIEYNETDYYDNCKLTCLDNAVKMKTNVDYSSLITNDDGTITPVSLEELLKWLCNYYGIILGTYPKTNRNYLISTYDSTLSGKYYISLIAELMGGMAHIDRTGTLNIIPIKQESTISINALKSKSWKYNSTCIISKVVYDNGKIRAEYGDDTGQTLYVRSDNMFVLDDYESLIENIYNAVVGTRIDSLKTENYGDPSLDSYDLIEYTLDEETYYTFHNSTITYEMNIISTVETSIPTATQTNTTNIISQDVETKVRKLQTTVNNQDLKIDTTITLAENNQERISKTEQNINNIQNLFQITGGINLIKNSVGYFDKNYWITSETGTFEFGEDTDLIGTTTSYSKISISNGTVTSTSDNITGLTLSTIKSFNFKIKQDEDTKTTVTLYGMSEEHPLYQKTFEGQIDWKEIYSEEECQFYIDSSELTLKIESTSTYDGQVQISDLMLNDGDKTSWQPASGEVWGTVIKMSQQGISCYSTEEGYITMMTSQGFQIRELHGSNIGDILHKFTTTGLETIDIIQTGKHTQQNLVHDIINSNNNEVYIEYIKG